MEQEIIQPIDKELLKSELTPERQLRMTNKSNNEIYVITAHNSPNVMKEIGRLREIAFREAGGGTGKSMDIDEFDNLLNISKCPLGSVTANIKINFAGTVLELLPIS